MSHCSEVSAKRQHVVSAIISVFWGARFDQPLFPAATSVARAPEIPYP